MLYSFFVYLRRRLVAFNHCIRSFRGAASLILHGVPENCPRVLSYLSNGSAADFFLCYVMFGSQANIFRILSHVFGCARVALSQIVHGQRPHHAATGNCVAAGFAA